ncbi:MAG: helix-turn-helix domain-containing protein [Solirubrobacterales bacterium]
MARNELTAEALTVAEAAKLAKVSQRTIHRWINEEGLPKLQPIPHGAVRIDRDELGAFLTRSREQRVKDRLRAIRARNSANGNGHQPATTPTEGRRQ